MGAFYGNVITNNNNGRGIFSITLDDGSIVSEKTDLTLSDDNFIIITKSDEDTILFSHKNNDIGNITAEILDKDLDLNTKKTFNVITYKFDEKGHCIGTRTNTIDLSALIELIK
jgi:hypothetical protein